jgi:hypothetical protein
MLCWMLSSTPGCDEQAIVMPDKAVDTLNIFKLNPLEVGLGAFVSTAIRGRSKTGFAALTFIVIAFGTLFVGPALRIFSDIHMELGSLRFK